MHESNFEKCLNRTFLIRVSMRISGLEMLLFRESLRNSIPRTIRNIFENL